MANEQPASPPTIMQRLADLSTHLIEEDALGPAFTEQKFLQWVGQYARESREYHSLSHMLDMTTVTDPHLTPAARHLSRIAGLFHDVDYPSINEDILPVSKSYIARYIDTEGEKSFLKPLLDSDTTGHMLYSIFGFKEGHELSAVPVVEGNTLVNAGGMNEFYSAAAAVGQLDALGKDNKTIAGVITGIEATIPFRGPNRIAELRQRLETTNNEERIGLKPNDIDDIMLAATHLANKDVSSFLGGLDPLIDTKPTLNSVIKTIQEGDSINPEEIAGMRQSNVVNEQGPGNYTSQDFLAARLKRAGLYQFVIPGNTEQQTIPNLFYETTLSDGSVYPPDNWKDKAAKLAYLNNEPIKLAQETRLISAGLVYSILAQAEHTDFPETKVKVVMNGVLGRMATQISTTNSDIRKLAFHCLGGRAGNNHDIGHSPFGELVLNQLDDETIHALAKQARILLTRKPPQTENFIYLATDALGETAEIIRDHMEMGASSAGKKSIAYAISKVDIPTEMSVRR